MEKLVRGMVREDGKVFACYRSQGRGEQWLSNTPKARENQKEWARNNKDKVHAKHKRWRTKPLNRIATNVRNRIWQALNGDKRERTCDYLGCSIGELMEHLESLFTEGMTWENYGVDGWHIDHRIPLASASCIEDMVTLLHFSNLQPLWALDNLRKSSSIPNS
jgi:hypothetical protein